MSAVRRRYLPVVCICPLSYDDVCTRYARVRTRKQPFEYGPKVIAHGQMHLLLGNNKSREV